MDNPRGGSSCPLFQGQIEIWKCWFLWRDPEKSPWSKDKKQQQTQLISDPVFWNWIHATVVRGECSSSLCHLHSHQIVFRATENSFYQFTSIITHVGCQENIQVGYYAGKPIEIVGYCFYWHISKCFNVLWVDWCNQWWVFDQSGCSCFLPFMVANLCFQLSC